MIKNGNNIRYVKVDNKVDIDNLYIRMIADTHSTSSAREIINDNFKNLSYGFEIIKNLPLDFILNIEEPKDVQKDVAYSIMWNEITNKYSFVPSYPFNGKWHIKRGERLVIPEDYQHIISGQFKNDGELVINGELVII